MRKKLILLGMAVAAFASFVMPAVASATTPTLWDHEGKVQVGAAITGTSTNAVTTNTALGELTCQHVLITGIVISNEEGTVSADGNGPGETTTCLASGEIPLTITKPQLLTMSTSGGDEGMVSMTYIADVGPFECHFAGEGPFTYDTGTGNDVVHIENLTLESAEVCQKEGTHPLFHGDFTLTTEKNGKEVWIQ